MAQSIKICPICSTTSSANSARCGECGTPLTDVAPAPVTSRRPPRSGYYDDYGETDLMESDGIGRRAVTAISALVGSLALIGIVAAAVVLLSARSDQAPLVEETGTMTPTLTLMVLSDPAALTAPAPAIVQPTPVFMTVTPLPPTPTELPTQGPCTRTVQAGDNLTSIAWACGHRSLDVIPLILELNNLSSAEMIQVGQTLLVPLPTAVPDPNAQSAVPPVVSVFASTNVDDTSGDLNVERAAAAPPPLAVQPTETLLPGIGWHIVQPNENMVVIANRYQTDAETLAQLNPEIPFSQCDFSVYTGGPRCVVFLVAGQQFRVPVPTATPTETWTPNGSETPTPTVTPTFNAPSPLSPPDRIFFSRNDLITLRWAATGGLAFNETYLVSIRDVTSGQEYVDFTRELFFVLPSDWQAMDNNRHEYIWTISVVTVDAPESQRFTTPPRAFIWEGRGENSP